MILIICAELLLLFVLRFQLRETATIIDILCTSIFYSIIFLFYFILFFLKFRFRIISVSRNIISRVNIMQKYKILCKVCIRGPLGIIRSIYFNEFILLYDRHVYIM